jgi:hypothetical protein
LIGERLLDDRLVEIHEADDIANFPKMIRVQGWVLKPPFLLGEV